MQKLKLAMLAVIFLTGGAALAANSGSQSFTMELSPGQTVEELQLKDVAWPEWFGDNIQAVNEGLYDLRVEIYNGPTRQRAAYQMAARDTTGQINAHNLSLILDAGLNVVREQNVNRLMGLKGLKKGKIYYHHDRDLVRPRIVFVFEEKDEESGLVTAAPSLTESVRGGIIGPRQTDEHSSDSNNNGTALCLGTTGWNLTVGGEGVVVTDGKPITVPAVELEIQRVNYMISFAGGYRPVSEQDQRFLAGSLAYLPRSNKIGLVLRVIYASDNLTDQGGYLQEGFGPTVGLVFRSDQVTGFLTVGIQYMDRRDYNRQVEPTINLGLSLHALSF